jgi:hypothetical protein
MKKLIATHIMTIDPSAANNVASGYNLGQNWINTTTGDKFYHKTDGVWIGLGNSNRVPKLINLDDGDYTIQQEDVNKLLIVVGATNTNKIKFPLASDITYNSEFEIVNATGDNFSSIQFDYTNVETTLPSNGVINSFYDSMKLVLKFFTVQDTNIWNWNFETDGLPNHKLRIVYKNSNYSVAPDDEVVVLTSGNATFNMPGGLIKKAQYFKNNGAGTLTLHCDTDAGFDVIGNQTLVLLSGESVVLFSEDSKKFYILADFRAVAIPTLEQTRSQNNSISGNINANGNTIINLRDAIANQEPVTLSQQIALRNYLLSIINQNDDVLPFDNLASFPSVGTSGVIYLALDTGLYYTWNGSTYVVSNPPGITGGGSINYLPKFSPTGSKIANSRFFDDGFTGFYGDSIFNNGVQFLAGANTFMRVQRGGSNFIDFVMGNSGIGQGNGIASNNSFSLYLSSASKMSFYVANSIEALTISALGRLTLSVAPLTGATTDKILVRNTTTGDIKQIDYPTIPTSVDFIEDVITNGVTNKAPSENAVFDALELKVDKVTGKGLSTEDYTTADKTKMSFITITQTVNLDDLETRVNDLDAAVILKGVWDASTSTFPGAGVAQAGWSYLVQGTPGVEYNHDGILFADGDRIICVLDNASTTIYAGNWYKADYTDRVNTVAGRTGNVVITSADLSDFNAAVAALITGKEDSSNKSTSTSDSASNVKFPVWSAVVAYFNQSRLFTILGAASATLSGYLTTTDWNIFNNKQDALTSVNFGVFSVSLGSKVTITDSDTTNISDTADTGKAKKVLWSDIWTNYLKVKTDNLYFLKIGGDLTGTAGAGYVGLPGQSVTPSTPAAGLLRIFSDTSGRLSWINSLGFSRTFRSAALTANRMYTLQDRDGTLADDTDLATKKGIGRTTFSNTNYSVLSTDRYVAQIGTLTAIRTATMPLASTVPAGETIVVANEGSLSSYRISVTPSGSDTINSITGTPAFANIIGATGTLYLMSDGISKWIISDIVMRSVNIFNTSGVTGTTVETEVIKIPIEANTLSKSDFFSIYALMGRTNTNGNIVLKLKFSTDGNLPSGTTNQIGTVTMATTTKSAPFTRRLYTYNNDTIISSSTATANVLVNDAIATTDPVFITGFNPTVKNWIHLSATLANAADLATHYAFTINN